jgi:LysM repeat protein
MTRKTSTFMLMSLILVLGSACSAPAVPTTTPIPLTSTVAASTPAVQPTATSLPPTATPVPPTAAPTLTWTPPPTDTPADTPTATVSPTSTTVLYVVKQNDSLFNIAAQFHVDVVALTQANQLTTTVLSVGQKLIIPGADFATATPSPIPTGLPRGYKVQYTVLLGDTLESIAAKFNSTVDAISKANPDPAAPKNTLRHLTNQNLQAAMVIVVPVNLATPVPPTATPNG